MTGIDRRGFVSMLGAAATSACVTKSALVSPFSAGSGPPNIIVPPHACDSHIHIMEPRFPAREGWRGGAVPQAGVQDYLRFQARIGTERVVVVTPSTYGTDNSATLDALAQLNGRARGVVVFDCDDPQPNLAAMTDRGVRGVRVNFVSPQTWGKTDVRRLTKTAELAADLGWHVQIYARATEIAQIEQAIATLPTSVVIDHLGSVAPTDGVGSAGHSAILRLLNNGRTWMKLSGAYISSVSGPPGYDDLTEIARSYVTTAPERMVWGSDWPHRGQTNKLPDDAGLIELLSKWAPDPLIRNAVLVDNPKKLYGF